MINRSWTNFRRKAFSIFAEISAGSFRAAIAPQNKSRRSRLFPPEQLEARIVLDSTVVFNEIMYNPAGPDETLEWIELHNQMAVDLDLSGWTINGGVEYSFPDNVVLEAGGYLVVAASPTDLQNVTGLSGLLGPYTDSLSNSGEQLELLDRNRRVMDSIDYGDDGSWPVAADGSGASLAKIRSQAATAPAENWVASGKIGGSPGVANFIEQTDGQFVGPQTNARILVPTSSEALLGTTWTNVSFDDSAWSNSSPAVGFDGDVSTDGAIIEDFSGPNGSTSLHPLLMAPAAPGNYQLQNNALTNPNQDNRTYVRTTATDFINNDFVFEITISLNNNLGPFDGVFFGIGAATPNPGFFGTPDLGFDVEILPEFGPRTRFRRTSTLNSAAVEEEAFGVDNGTVGDGIHRLRLTKTGDVMQFEIDADYTGVFSADVTSTPINVTTAGNDFLDDTNSRLFFGGGRNVTFDDLRIVGIQEANSPLPRLYFPLEGSARDASGNETDGVLTGGQFSFQVSSEIAVGQSLELDGVDDLVEIVDPVDVAAYTLSAWVQLDTVQPTNIIMRTNSAGAMSELSYQLRVNQSGRFEHFLNDGTLRTVTGTTIVQPGQWYHVTGIAESNGQMRLLVDGVEEGTPLSVNTLSTSGDRWQIGTPSTGAANFLDGKIDDVAIWDVPLNATDIAALSSGISPLALNGYLDHINTNIKSTMQDSNASVWMRLPFALNDPAALASLTLDMKYDDGFVAYLNGVKVAERNAPAFLFWDSQATAQHDDREALLFEPIDLTPFLSALVPGENILAIQGLNASIADSDFLLVPELFGETVDPNGLGNSLAINEVTSATDAQFWLELVNTADTAAELGGIVVANSNGGEYVLPSQVLEPGGFLVLSAETLGFSGSSGDKLFLFTPDKTAVIDGVSVKNRPRGRSLDGTGRLQTPDTLTPGAANSFDLNSDVVINEILYHHSPEYGTPSTPANVDTTTLLPFDSLWQYDDSGPGMPDEWKSAGSSPTGRFLGSGQGLIGFETMPEQIPEPILTELTDPALNNPRLQTYYFRQSFTFDGNLDEVDEIVLNSIIDDGAVFYLNGQELLRQNMPGGVITYETSSASLVFEAVRQSVVLPKTLLVEGENLLAVEVHQPTSQSSDIIFGVELQARSEVTPALPGTPLLDVDEEWIELFNRSTTDTIDLGSWKLDQAINYDFPLGTTIGPNQYLVIAKDPAAVEATHAISGVLGPFSGTLKNSNELIRLVDANKNIADEVHYYDDGQWGTFADGGGSSLELRNPFADNAKAEVWEDSDESSRSVWQTVTYTQTVQSQVFAGSVNFQELLLGLLDDGEVLLDNISVIEDPAGVALELMQNGTFENDTIGQSAESWRLLGTHGRSQVVQDPLNPDNQVLRLISDGRANDISDHAETTLANGAIVKDGTTYQISYDARWLAGSPQLHSELYYQDVARTTILDTPDRSGTPGAINSRFQANVGPTYGNLQHSPLIPTSNDQVTVSVTAEDPDGVSSLTLWYVVDSGAKVSAPMTLKTDGQYAASIPPQAQNAIVQFWIQGQDSLGGDGSTSAFPAAGEDSRALYQVDNNGISDSPRYDFRLLMAPDDATWIYQTTNGVSNNRIGSTVIYNGNEVFYDVGTRLRGSLFTRGFPNQVGYNIKFHKDQLFRGVHESVATKTNDPRQIQIDHLINQLGVLGGQYNDVIDLSTSSGLGEGPALLLLARQGTEFLDSQFKNGSDGTIHKLDGVVVVPSATVDPGNDPEAPKVYWPPSGVPEFDIKDLGDTKEFYRWPYRINGNRDNDDFTGIIAMAQALSLEGEALELAAAEALDVDQWMRTLALMSLAGISDVLSQPISANGGSPHNMNFYTRPEDGKVLFLPWDWSFAFVRPSNAPLHGNKNIGKLIERPIHERSFFGHMLDMVNTRFSEEYMSQWLTFYGSLLGEPFAGNASYLTQRSEFVTGQISAEFPAVDFAVTTAGPLVVDQSLVVVEGTGWVDVREIRLFGSDRILDVTWKTNGGPNADTWEVTIPVASGNQSYLFEAYDFQGNLIDTSSIDITSTVPRPIVDQLRISELMYNPDGPDDSEFVELVNISDTPIDSLAGVTFADGVVFAFPDISLAASERIVIVRDQSAFEAAYGTGHNIAGSFDTSALNNDGERIVLVDGDGAVIQEFTYNDIWYPTTDGDGFSLVIVDESGDLANWNDPAGWRPSFETGGSPGTADLLQGDVNLDNRVSLTDMALMQSNFGTLSEATRDEGDLTGEGAISRADIQLLLRNYGRSYMPQVVGSPLPKAEPSPSAIVSAAPITSEQTQPIASRKRTARRSSLRVIRAPAVDAVVGETSRIKVQSSVTKHRRIRRAMLALDLRWVLPTEEMFGEAKGE